MAQNTANQIQTKRLDPAILDQDEGNDRCLEAHKITALTTNARQIAKLLAVSVAETGSRW